jgi:hypothetical protein
MQVVDLKNRKFVDREQLRFKGRVRSFKAPFNLNLLSTPTPPDSFDWSKGETITFPIYGNDKYGDCYAAAVAHGSNCYTGNSGTECVFDVSALTARYLQLSGGDNGLDDSIIMPEWKSGIIGPNGPRKILDEMVVDVHNIPAATLSCWAFGGLIWTCSLLNSWVNLNTPGAVWDDDGSGANPGYGHAMFLTGKHANGNWDTRTWGISPPIQVTPKGIAGADSEFIVAFSLDQFKEDGTSAFTGLSYEQMAQLWYQCGGKELPPSPFTNLKPVIDPTSLKSLGTVGVVYSYNISATNNATSYTAEGLPAGLSLNSNNIYGTPTVSGVFNVKLSATNSSGTGTATLVLTIAAPLTPPIDWNK